MFSPTPRCTRDALVVVIVYSTVYSVHSCQPVYVLYHQHQPTLHFVPITPSFVSFYEPAGAISGKLLFQQAIKYVPMGEDNFSHVTFVGPVRSDLVHCPPE